MRLYINSFFKITSLLKQNRFIVLVVIFILSILEFLSISSLIPLIYALFNPDELNYFLMSNFSIQVNMNIKVFALIFVIFIFSLRFILTSLFIYFLFSYNRKLKGEISFKILDYSLKSTDNFINKNISTFQKQINMNVDYVVDIFVIPIFQLLSELLIIFLLFMLSFLIIGKNIFIPAIILTAISYLYIKLLSKQQNYYSNQISKFTSGCNNELKKIFDLSNELIFKKKSNFFTKNFMIAREGLNKAIMIFQIILGSYISLKRPIISLSVSALKFMLELSLSSFLIHPLLIKIF